MLCVERQENVAGFDLLSFLNVSLKHDSRASGLHTQSARGWHEHSNEPRFATYVAPSRECK
jgi:hypothetical protein